MTTVEVFSRVADILKKCSDIVVEAAPSAGFDVLASDAAPITTRDFSDRDLTIQVQAFREIGTLLQEAEKLSEELSIGSYAREGFTDQGVRTLYADIGTVNTAATLIRKVASDALAALPKDSPQADLIKNRFAEAQLVYKNLSVFTRKAKVPGKLPAVNTLKNL